MVNIGAIIFVNRRGNRVCGAYTSSLLALTVQHVLECIVMDGITKLSDSFTTFDTIKPIYFTATLICSDALPILGVISAVTFIRV